jgi:hypothetical protein
MSEAEPIGRVPDPDSSDPVEDVLFREGRDIYIGLNDADLARYIQTRVLAARAYTGSRRRVWRLGASWTHMSTLALSAAATIVLGVSQRDGFGHAAFALSALVTTAAAIEPFYNFRSRWVLAEEILADWYRLEEQLTMYLASTEAAKVDRAEILGFDAEYDRIWQRFSEQWVHHRRSG